MAQAAEGVAGNAPDWQPPCVRIVDAFADFAYDADTGIPFTFDVFVEANVKQVNLAAADQNMNSLSLQINQVRKFFSECIKSKQCMLRVHWSDPYFHGNFDRFQRQQPHATRQDLAEEHIHNLPEANTYAFRKQLEQANISAMLEGWPDWVRKYAIEESKSDIEAAFMGRRIMMDLYVLSRIVKPPSSVNDPHGKLCNVIYYAGNAHTQFAARVCEHLGFKEEWNMGENPCDLQGMAIRKIPHGMVFGPRGGSGVGRRHSLGAAARDRFNQMCDTHFGSKRLVGVMHSARWFNERTGQTIYFLGERHVEDRGIGEGLQSTAGPNSKRQQDMNEYVKNRNERLRLESKQRLENDKRSLQMTLDDLKQKGEPWGTLKYLDTRASYLQTILDIAILERTKLSGDALISQNRLIGVYRLTLAKLTQEVTNEKQRILSEKATFMKSIEEEHVELHAILNMLSDREK